MIKNVCDRCGKEWKISNKYVYIGNLSSYDFGDKKYKTLFKADLCSECAVELLEFFSQYAEPVETMKKE